MGQRLIDASKVNPTDAFGGLSDFAQDCRNAVVELLNAQPTVDAVPFVRCGAGSIMHYSDKQVQSAMKIVIKSLSCDKSGGSWYDSWQSNLACVVMDNSNVDHETANTIATKFLECLCRECETDI